MSKKLLFILLISISVFAQNKSIKVIYGLKIGYDEGFSTAPSLKDSHEAAQKGAEQINFTLIANREHSYFRLNDVIETEETEFAKSFSVATNSYFTNSETSNKIKYVDSFLGEFLINYTEITDWKLESDTKLIDGFLCIKATAEQIVVRPNKTFRHPIIAWYCPSIPFNYGPNGYNGLPGLILELQVRNISWGAKKIEVSKEDIEVEKPKKGKVISEEEYNKLLSAPPMFTK